MNYTNFLHFTFLFMVHLVQNLKNFSKFEVQIRSSVVILPKLGHSLKFSRWIIINWTSCMFSYFSIYFNNFSKIEVQIRSSVIVIPTLGCSKFGRSNNPTWGRRWLTFEKVRDDPPPQLRIRPPTWKIHQWNHNIWSSRIFRRSVFWRSNLVFSLSTFSPFRRWSFCVRSFGVGSLLGLGSNSAFGHSAFGHLASRLSAFGHSASRLSVFCRWILLCPFLGLCCEIGPKDGAFFGLWYPAVPIAAQLFHSC